MTGVTHKQQMEARTLELAGMAQAMHDKAGEIEELRRQQNAQVEARECVYLCGHQICVGCATEMQGDGPGDKSPCPVRCAEHHAMGL